MHWNFAPYMMLHYNLSLSQYSMFVIRIIFFNLYFTSLGTCRIHYYSLCYFCYCFLCQYYDHCHISLFCLYKNMQPQRSTVLNKIKTPIYYDTYRHKQSKANIFKKTTIICFLLTYINAIVTM